MMEELVQIRSTLQIDFLLPEAMRWETEVLCNIGCFEKF